MNKFVSGVLLLVISCSLSSCSFHKLIKGKVPKIQTGADTTHIAKTEPVGMPKDSVAMVNRVADSISMVRHLIEEVTPIWNNRLAYKTFKGKARVHIDGPDGRFEFAAYFRIRKDSVIWIEADAMGGLYRIKILITRDSISMINYAQKEVTRMPLTQAARLLPTKVDFASLQNLVIGEPLRGGNITDAKNIDGLWAIRVEDSAYIQQITYSKQDSTMHNGELTTRDPFGPKAMSQYSAYDTANSRRISTQRVLDIRNGDNVYTLDLKFVKAEFDEPLDFPFNIPGNYAIKE